MFNKKGKALLSNLKDAWSYRGGTDPQDLGKSPQKKSSAVLGNVGKEPEMLSEEEYLRLRKYYSEQTGVPGNEITQLGNQGLFNIGFTPTQDVIDTIMMFKGSNNAGN